MPLADRDAVAHEARHQGEALAARDEARGERVPEDVAAVGEELLADRAAEGVLPLKARELVAEVVGVPASALGRGEEPEATFARHVASEEPHEVGRYGHVPVGVRLRRPELPVTQTSGVTRST